MGAYSSFENSPASKGILQFDMWGVTPPTNRYDWSALKEEIKNLWNAKLASCCANAYRVHFTDFGE